MITKQCDVRIVEEGSARKTDANLRPIVAGDKYENRLESYNNIIIILYYARAVVGA